MTIFLALTQIQTVSAYKLSDMRDLKRAEKLCNEGTMEMACAKAVDLFSDIYAYDGKIRIKTFGDTPLRVLLNRQQVKFYKKGCQLGDKIQCYKHGVSVAELQYARGFSSLDEGFNKLFHNNDKQLNRSIFELKKKYLGKRSFPDPENDKLIREKKEEWFNLVELPLDVIIKRTASGQTKAVLVGYKTYQHPYGTFVLTKEKFPRKDREKIMKKIIGKNYELLGSGKHLKHLSEADLRAILRGLGITKLELKYAVSKDSTRILAVKPKNRFNSMPKTNASLSNSHSHAGRSHTHKLPEQGKHHRHGNGALGR